MCITCKNDTFLCVASLVIFGACCNSVTQSHLLHIRSDSYEYLPCKCWQNKRFFFIIIKLIIIYATKQRIKIQPLFFFVLPTPLIWFISEKKMYRLKNCFDANDTSQNYRKYQNIPYLWGYLYLKNMTRLFLFHISFECWNIFLILA